MVYATDSEIMCGESAREVKTNENKFDLPYEKYFKLGLLQLGRLTTTSRLAHRLVGAGCGQSRVSGGRPCK
jgi:hypothetical protein